MAKPDRIFASELLEREVMDLRAGEIVGAVTDFNVTRDGVVTQLGVLPLAWYRGGRGIAPGAITNVTRERVSIEDSTLLDEFAPDGETSLSAMLGDNVYGKQVLQADGELLGSLADFAFDLSDGRITDIVVFGDDDKRSKIGVDHIQTIGKSYIVVSRSGAAEVQPGPKPAAAGKADTIVRNQAEEPAPPVAAANALEVEEPLGSTGWPAESALAEAVAVEPELPAAAALEVETAPPPSEAEALAEPAPEVAESVPAVVEEIEPPLAGSPVVAAAEELSAVDEDAAVEVETPAAEVEEPRRPRRPTPTGRGTPQVADDDEDLGTMTPTGRRSRPRSNVTGRSSTPRVRTRAEQQQMELESEAAAEAASAPESLDGLGLSTFDRRKAEFLLGKPSHRDVRGGDGKLLLTRGTPFTPTRIGALLEQGLLNSIFLEMTQQKN